MRDLENKLEQLVEQLTDSIKIIEESRQKIVDRNNAIPISLPVPSNHDYQKMIAQTELTVFIVDLQGIVVHLVGNAFEGKIEGENESFVGMSVFDIFDEFLELKTALRSAIDGNKSKCIIHFNKKYFSLSFSPIFEDIGHLRGVCIVIADTTGERLEELKLQNKVQQLDSFNHDLEQFAYVASHDLHEPLRMVTNFLQLLEQEYGEKLDEDGKSYISFAVDGATRMQKLIDNLLLYNRVGKPELNLKEIKISNIIELKLYQLSKLIEERNAKIKIEKLPDKIIGEAKQIGLVFYNLIKNAIIFNGNKEPNVKITYKEYEKDWLFSISDNGIGIDYKYKDFVFNPFWNLHLDEKNDGTGIGLAIAKKVVVRHGGKIWFESAVNKGSVFYFTISKMLS